MGESRWRNFRNKYPGDKGDSLVTAVIVFPMVFSIIVTGVDFGLFLNNKAIIMNAARDGARTVAIQGGASTSNNKIAQKYGQTKNCKPSEKVGVAGVDTPLECTLLKRLSTSSLVQTDITSVNCTPNFTTRVGETTSCDIKWKYVGLPWSTLGFTGYNGRAYGYGEKDTADGIGSGEGLSGENITHGTASAETNNTPSKW